MRFAVARARARALLSVQALATVIADVDCSLLQLSQQEYQAMVSSDPDRALRLTTYVLQKTTERLAATNALVRDLANE